MRVEQEEDFLPGRLLTAIAFVVVVIGFAASYWAYLLLRGDVRELEAAGRMFDPELPRPAEVSGIEQETFGGRSQAERVAEPARRRLGSYGWIDRERGVVHVPIDRAIDLYVTEEGAQ